MHSNPRRLVGLSIITIAVMLFVSAGCTFYTSYRTTTLGKALHVPGSANSLKQPAITCKTPKHANGDVTETVTSGGLKRTYLMHLPASYGKQPLPLILVYHGYSWTSQVMEGTTGFDKEADKVGFVLAYPQGVDTPPSWNAGVGAYGPTGDADDIQFTRDMLNAVEQTYCVDMHRVYITGFSLGGGMVYRLACVLSNKFAAVATVSGAYYPFPEGCHPTRPLPIMEIHGAADDLAPYAGNASTRMGGVQDYLNGWVGRNGCTGDPTTFFQKDDVTGTEWTKCANNTIVRHYRVSDGKHTWPGSPGTTQVIDANVVVWNFFSPFALP